MELPLVTVQGYPTSGSSTSPSRSMLHQYLSFSFAGVVQDASDFASSISCAVLEDADIASSVLEASDEEQESKEERSWLPDHGPVVLVTFSLCKMLALSLSHSNLINLCFKYQSLFCPLLLQLLQLLVILFSDSVLVLSSACPCCSPPDLSRLLVFHMDIPHPPSRTDIAFPALQAREDLTFSLPEDLK